MGIVNNISSNMILGELHKNTKKKDKASAQLALGEKIRNAGDDASGFAISEKMRVRIRALGQDEDNVKKGASMLKTAEGAIQSQINLLRTIKEKVIDAHNDTNTDTDRAIIQKEIDQYYQEIDDISVETVFNKRILLRGNAVDDVVESWRVLDHPVLVEGSDSLDMIPNIAGLEVLDEKDGPFDTFGKTKAADSREQYDWDGYWQRPISDATSIKGYDANSTNAAKTQYHDGKPNDPNTVDIDLSHYSFSSSNKTSLDNVSFIDPGGYVYTLTTDTSRNYRGTHYKIDISSCSSTADVADKIAASINSHSSYFTATKDGSTVKLTTKRDGTSSNSYTISGRSSSGGSLTTGATGENRTGAGKTGLSSVNPVKFSGGADAVIKTKTVEKQDPTNPDRTMYEEVSYEESPAKSATATITGVNGVASGTGITLNLNRTYYLAFVDGSSGLTPDTGRYTIGKNYSGNFTIGNCSFTMSNGTITITAPKNLGASGNYYGGSDGITASSVTPGTTIENYYTPTTALGYITNNKTGKDGDTAYWELDATAYADVDDAINSLVGKAFSPSGSSRVYEFVNLDAKPSMDSVHQISGSTQIDLGRLKSLVEDEGKTLPQAFATLLKNVYRATATEKGVKFNATIPGDDGNSQTMSFYEGHLRQYTIDFDKIVKDKGIKNIPEALDNKGFRFYCATDASEWVNVHFVNGIDPAMDDKPQSGTDADRIRTVMIDVSGITSVEELIKTIYEGNDKNPQGLADYLKDEYKHNFLAAADYKKGTLTIYDKRYGYVMDEAGKRGYKQLRSHGAKIADGVMDNVVKDKRYIRVNRLIIHHTDKSSMNIKIDIPQTSMDHVFGFIPENKSISEFNVMTSKMREALLGTDGPPKVEGYLDKGLQYLIDANTLIGAQIVHMEHAEANIITDQESTTSAESVIRDADMAKSSLELATAQILAQSGQAMLSQSNQNSSSVLSLLQ